jgi:plasmid maintenance system antidote protein VapI
MTKIQKLLRERRKSINWLATAIRFNRTNGRHVILGRLPATTPMRKKIAEVLGVTVDEIFCADGLAAKDE